MWPGPPPREAGVEGGVDAGLHVGEAEAVAAADGHPGLARLAPQALDQRRVRIAIQVTAPEDEAGAGTAQNRVVEGRFEARIGHAHDNQVGGCGKLGDRGIARQSLDLLVPRVDEVELARESVAPQRHHDRMAGGPDARRGTDDGHRARCQQRRHPVAGAHSVSPPARRWRLLAPLPDRLALLGKGLGAFDEVLGVPHLLVHAPARVQKSSMATL